MIEIKEEFNNGVFDCLKIYDKQYKILHKTNGRLYVGTEEKPVIIPKSRLNEYEASDVSIDVKEDVKTILERLKKNK